MSATIDKLVHATAAGNQVRLMAAITTELVGEACRRHGTSPTASVALGRVLTGGLLLGSGLKDLEKITVQFHCEGPIGNIIAQSDSSGGVRGYVSNPEADVTRLNGRGKFDVRALVSGGTMYVTRDAGFEIGLMKEAYQGSVPIVSGEIGEDFAYYLAKSEQINSAVSLGVLMTVDADEQTEDWGSRPEFPIERLKVAVAGGYIVQMMPSAEEELIRDIERVVREAPSVTEMIRAGLNPYEILSTALGDLNISPLDETEPKFYCQCSRERALHIISALGRAEVEDMLAKDNGAELTCHFCNERYQIRGDELSTLLRDSSME